MWNRKKIATMCRLGFYHFIMFCFYSCIIAQKVQHEGYTQENVAKYSYFIYGDKDRNSIEQGTGFFLKNRNRLYFATAAHILLSWDFKNNKPTSPPIDTFFLRLPKKNSIGFYFYPISVNIIRERFRKGYAFEYPDLCFIEILNSKEYDINIINFSHSKYPISKNISDVFIWGFPVNDTINDRGCYMTLPSSESVGKTIADYFKKVYWPDHNVYDSINYQIKIIKGPCKNGMSGSPIFLKTSTSRNLVFGGMVIMGDPLTMDIHAIRPEIVISEILRR